MPLAVLSSRYWRWQQASGDLLAGNEQPPLLQPSFTLNEPNHLADNAFQDVRIMQSAALLAAQI
ncbi:hypothetical protein HFO94_32595 [Rhizobium leguminosarum]|uniref:hypothetical protein n=1 Tax=Rhizobium leguminosarum TaxID=384 RepID=UPI001C91E72C|nr:hypothetical protein [Rhizobium leguminosarum]MBY3031265.1 hypothetical protein [Rhizobium leguminosarum]MBY5358182.1 hypothetical protein [Rhizobium leguminosarum]MBY5768300.1 hypothetical protein [Rhizobium leguminosarum]